ncbi:hypothetical protein Sru01_22570 [Sphaerisporangium rufum]|uniref:Uncharacterized protein n=1 Tax=Sphaerisporangium rufum TaxID=1381558 RepID=A0A919R2P3_9ACTN|nr:hypothetical protein Sru01_22570 [Sphaerisporangium rufum]
MLGLLLIVLAGAAVVAVANDGAAGAVSTVTVLDRTLELSRLELFLAGAATAAVFLIGLMALAAGMRRSGAKRRKLREARMETRDRVARLEEEKRRLEQRLADERTEKSAPVATAPAGPAHDRDGDGVDDRAERRDVLSRDAERRDAEPAGTSTQPHPAVPGQRESDRLVAGGHNHQNRA